MRKIIYILFSFIFVSMAVGDQYHNYNMNKLGIIPGGEEYGNISVREGLMCSPVGFFVRSNGDFIIADTLNKRLAIFDENLNFIENIDDISHIYNSHILEESGQFIFGTTNGNIIQLYNKQTNREYYIDLNNIFSITRIFRYSSLFYDEIVFFYTYSDHKISSIILPSSEDSEIQVLNREETRALIEEGNTNLNGLTIDNFDRLFVGEELITRTYDTFIDYYINELEGEEQMTSLASVETSPHDLASNSRYIGRDLDGNYYWNDNQAVAVFNTNGYFLDLIFLDRDKRMVFPDIDREGNIYSMSIDQDQNQVSIYKIPRQW